METLPGSRTAKREGNAGAQVDPRKTNLTLGSEKVLYRTSSQSELVNHYDGPKKAVTTKSNTAQNIRRKFMESSITLGTDKNEYTKESDKMVNHGSKLPPIPK